MEVQTPRSTAPDAFGEQFEELFAIAYRVAYRITGSRDDAVDLAQEALARAAARWPGVADHARAWVATVAANLAISWWRKQRRRDAERPAGDGHGSAEHVAERLDLVRALGALPRRQREIVVLRYLADRSEADVAAALGCSVGSVKSQASRGLAVLREVMRDPEEA
jgi:RNA polymerase sigma-70 factor (sigma-E family)